MNLRIAIWLLCVVICAGTALPAWAGFDAGMKAYQNKDYATAMREFRAAGNVAPAHFNIGVMYYRGEGVKQDKKEAARWLRKAAEQGHAKSQFLLSAMYFSGDGIDQNIPEAVKWIQSSARKGLDEAQFRLGMMYVNGDNVEKNRAEGVKWLKKAAKQGHGKARKLLSVMGESHPAVKPHATPKTHPAPSGH